MQRQHNMTDREAQDLGKGQLIDAIEWEYWEGEEEAATARDDESAKFKTAKKHPHHCSDCSDCSDEDVVNEMCLVNGVSYKNIAKEGSNVKSLEIFFSGFPRMVGLSHFPRLCQLVIIGQNIKNIEGLECCPLLRELWVAQCHLTTISGLQNCIKLKKLYLYDNQIVEINNLELQTNLEILWLNNNYICHIKGLNTLQNLKELNLADNLIEKVGQNLDPNLCIQNLNLSGNKIRSFKELTCLVSLQHLKILVLNDPTSTPNPVCLLANYTMHVLYHMPRLQRLDNYDLSSKQILEAAQSAVMKKMIYYNMRVRMVQRNMVETRVCLAERKRTLLQLPEECIRTLSLELKHLELELPKLLAESKESISNSEDEPAELELFSGSSEEYLLSTDQSTENSEDAATLAIIEKIEALKERLKLWMTRLAEIEACYEHDLAQAINITNCTVEFLLMELGSLGNIRLDEGSPSDPWFSSCCELLLSSFSLSDYKIQGITGIRVDSAFRIFHRAMKRRFDDKIHSLLARKHSHITSQTYRRQVEYLFYTTDTSGHSENKDLLYIIENGFKTAEEYKALGQQGAIPLSNSLGVTDQPRIEQTLENACKHKARENLDAAPFRHGQIIISKVFVGNSKPIHDDELIDRSNHPSLCSVYRDVNIKYTNLSDEMSHSPTTDACPEGSLCPKQWYVFDHELVLPEYIVYFQYITENQEDIMDKDKMSENIIMDKKVLSKEPKLFILEDKFLLNISAANFLSQITELNLYGNSLSKIKEVYCLTALRYLNISFNEFSNLEDISYMAKLEILDVSFNRLVTLKGLRGLSHLKQLDVRWNKLTKARENAEVLRKHAPKLLRLDTRHNPWNRQEGVRMTILGHLKSLTYLDDVKVGEDEAASAVDVAACSKISQASLLAHSRTNDDRPSILSLLSTPQLLCLLNPPPWGLSRKLKPDWITKITSLNLDNQRISKLINLNKLVNLRWASFNNNNISDVEGLESCQRLEELFLDNNNIHTLNGLSNLQSLNKLSLDGNQISNLDALVLDELSSLTFLSVENNFISSLYGIQRIQSLHELYIGNNQIYTSRDIYHLKAMKNLIILDLYGNPLVDKLENYRIYVVFHLPSLEALDGLAVKETECESAQDMFGGRLTSDMVAEKLDHSNFAEIPYLTLKSCSIKSVDLSPAEMFRNLHTVSLDHNNLTSFSGLIYLPNIKVLYLNHNHIESVLPKQRTNQNQQTPRQVLYSKVTSSGYGQHGNKENGGIVSLEPLMGTLEVLHLGHNGIADMANLQLSRLTNLRVLFLQGNRISQVEGMQGLRQLRELVLDRNQIKFLGKNSFIAQNLLLELHLAGNRIRELNYFNPLNQLRKLCLDMNKLQSITEIEKLKVLTSLTELSVVGNPVAHNSLHRQAAVLHLPRLQLLDGAMVTLEERMRAELLGEDPSLSYHCPGISHLTTEIYIPGLLPFMPLNAPLRVVNVSGGVQAYGNAAQGEQPDVMFRYIRTGDNLPTTVPQHILKPGARPPISKWWESTTHVATRGDGL